MKRFLTLIVCLLLVTVLSSNRASAGGAGGGSLEITQNLNRIILIAQKVSASATALNTQFDMIKNTILDPIANGLINIALQTTSNNILSWVNGGMNGNPLIVSNPEQYIKNQGLLEVRKALTSLPENSDFGDGIFQSIVGTYLDTGLKEKLATVAKSSIPSTVQRNMCADDMLTSLANNRATNADGVLDTLQAQVEKQYLYGYACSCDPNTDQDCSAKLKDLYDQDTSLGGDDAWLALTGGDNQFVKTQMAKAIVREEVEKKKMLALEDLKGLGTISEKKCLREETDLTGGTFCAESAVLNPGKSVQAALDVAANAGIERLTNILGAGSLSSILTGFIQQSLFKGLNQGLSSLTGGSNNISQITSSSAPQPQDLVGDPDRKSELLDSMMQQVDFNSTTVSNLEKIDADYINGLNSYQSKVTQVKTCFSGLVSQGITQEGNASVVAAYAYYDDRMARINQAKNTLATDATKINIAKQLTSTTVTQLNNSNSSQEISNIFNAYTKSYSSQKLPTNATEAEREQERIKNENEASNDTAAETHLKTCNQISQDYWNAQNYYYNN